MGIVESSSPGCSAPQTLDAGNWQSAIRQLLAVDAGLQQMVERYGPPLPWTMPGGFAGLTLTILAQQISLESAHAVSRKLKARLGEVQPAGFLALDDAALRQMGFSRQKAGYVRGLAAQILAGKLDLDQLAGLDNESARQRLMQLRGVGRWTADTYLLFALCRADAWPSGDLALETAMAPLIGQHGRLERRVADRMAARWRPWRALAARILWTAYLHDRGRFEAVAASWEAA